MEDVEADRYTKLFLTYALFYAKPEILLLWKYPTPPTIEMWSKTINSVTPLYKITFESRNCPQKFDKEWSTWIDAYGRNV